jgi:hypothetical protein
MRSREIDFHAAVAAHPWRAVTIAFTAGAALALTDRSRLGRAMLAVAATDVAMLRELAVHRMSTFARSWLDERTRAYAES